jgi:hypothetical protein
MESRIIIENLKLKNALNELRKKDTKFYQEIQTAFLDIQDDVFCGRNVKKELIPKKYHTLLYLDNLWIYNLRRGWRLIYTVSNPNKVEVLAVILDWMSHKDYERLFGF